MIKSSLTPPSVDQATIDHYVAKGRRERSHAFLSMLRSLFTAPEKLAETSARSLPRKTGCAA